MDTTTCNIFYHLESAMKHKNYEISIYWNVYFIYIITIKFVTCQTIRCDKIE